MQLCPSLCTSPTLHAVWFRSAPPPLQQPRLLLTLLQSSHLCGSPLLSLEPGATPAVPHLLPRVQCSLWFVALASKDGSRVAPTLFWCSFMFLVSQATVLLLEMPAWKLIFQDAAKGHFLFPSRKPPGAVTPPVPSNFPIWCL